MIKKTLAVSAVASCLCFSSNIVAGISPIDLAVHGKINLGLGFERGWRTEEQADRLAQLQKHDYMMKKNLNNDVEQNKDTVRTTLERVAEQFSKQQNDTNNLDSNDIEQSNNDESIIEDEYPSAFFKDKDEAEEYSKKYELPKGALWITPEEEIDKLYAMFKHYKPTQEQIKEFYDSRPAVQNVETVESWASRHGYKFDFINNDPIVNQNSIKEADNEEKNVESEPKDLSNHDEGNNPNIATEPLSSDSILLEENFSSAENDTQALTTQIIDTKKEDVNHRRNTRHTNPSTVFGDWYGPTDPSGSSYIGFTASTTLSLSSPAVHKNELPIFQNLLNGMKRVPLLNKLIGNRLLPRFSIRDIFGLNGQIKLLFIGESSFYPFNGGSINLFDRKAVIGFQDESGTQIFFGRQPTASSKLMSGLDPIENFKFGAARRLFSNLMTTNENLVFSSPDRDNGFSYAIGYSFNAIPTKTHEFNLRSGHGVWDNRLMSTDNLSTGERSHLLSIAGSYSKGAFKIVGTFDQLGVLDLLEVNNKVQSNANITVTSQQRVPIRMVAVASQYKLKKITLSGVLSYSCNGCNHKMESLPDDLRFPLLIEENLILKRDTHGGKPYANWSGTVGMIVPIDNNNRIMMGWNLAVPKYSDEQRNNFLDYINICTIGFGHNLSENTALETYIGYTPSGHTFESFQKSVAFSIGVKQLF